MDGTADSQSRLRPAKPEDLPRLIALLVVVGREFRLDAFRDGEAKIDERLGRALGAAAVAEFGSGVPVQIGVDLIPRGVQQDGPHFCCRLVRLLIRSGP